MQITLTWANPLLPPTKKKCKAKHVPNVIPNLHAEVRQDYAGTVICMLESIE